MHALLLAAGLILPMPSATQVAPAPAVSVNMPRAAALLEKLRRRASDRRGSRPVEVGASGHLDVAPESLLARPPALLQEDEAGGRGTLASPDAKTGGASKSPSRRRRRVRTARRAGPAMEVVKDDFDMFGPLLAVEPLRDIADLAIHLEDSLSRPRGTPTWDELAREYPAELLVEALGRVLARGPELPRHRAAEILGEAPGATGMLILLQEARRKQSFTVKESILRSLKRFGATSPDHPVAESTMRTSLNRIASEKPPGVAEHLVSMLNSYPEFRLPLIRTLALIEAKEAVPALRSLGGMKGNVGPEALGALMYLGEDYEVHRMELGKALARLAEDAETRDGAFQSVVFYLTECGAKRNDHSAVAPIFYLLTPNTPDTTRTRVLAALRPLAISRPAVFVSALALLPLRDQETFVPEFVQDLFESAKDREMLDSWHVAFRDLDLDFRHHDLVRLVRNRVTDQIK